ncbi:MAG: polyprenyl synthetase family protein [Pikeienuella sp.]|uniref:polyprenyl synthetase family protein n=1 Tax=Pikeienuella sp. TaxID=2831957 RepID=UPI00391A2B72
MSPEAERAFAARLAASARRAEAALDAALPPEGAGAEGRLAAAMRRGALAGGKRLRAFLVIETAALFGAEEAGADRAAAALECLHAYSLVHDDLPCMDDDDLRRGLPTVHVEWDEATAVLAGDALQTLAFELLADPAAHPDPARRAEMCLILARASGFAGMVGGQALDIAAETAERPLTVEEIAALQAKKTGALIRVAAEIGAVLGGADAEARAALVAYGAALGAAFQIADDILDATGDEAAAGKRLGKDGEAGKATYVSLLGLETARARAAALADEAALRLAPFGPRAAALEAAARFAVSRTA